MAPTDPDPVDGPPAEGPPPTGGPDPATARPGGAIDPPADDEEGAGRPVVDRTQLDREWRAAMVVAVVLLLLGQVLLLVGWWPLALVAVALPGSIAAVVLLRRWKRLGG